MKVIGLILKYMAILLMCIILSCCGNVLENALENVSNAEQDTVLNASQDTAVEAVQDTAHKDYINETHRDSVYICSSAKSKKYHRTQYCRGLSRCSCQVKKMTIEQAEHKGMTPCKICY